MDVVVWATICEGYPLVFTYEGGWKPTPVWLLKSAGSLCEFIERLQERRRTGPPFLNLGSARATIDVVVSATI